MARGIIKQILLATLAAATLSSCIHPMVRFRKARLLDPMMDPGKAGGLYSGLIKSEATNNVEHGTGESGGSLGASCPTCGG